jgi:hypothetical protein
VGIGRTHESPASHALVLRETSHAAEAGTIGKHRPSAFAVRPTHRRPPVQPASLEHSVPTSPGSRQTPSVGLDGSDVTHGFSKLHTPPLSQRSPLARPTVRHVRSRAGFTMQKSGASHSDTPSRHALLCAVPFAMHVPTAPFAAVATHERPIGHASVNALHAAPSPTERLHTPLSQRSPSS